jgi:hypothetical protein
MSPVFGHYIPKNNNFVPSGHPVCVAATFNAEAKVRPDAFGVEVNGMRFRYIIKSATLTKELIGTRVYRCEYVDLGLIKTINLIYYIHEHRWTAE